MEQKIKEFLEHELKKTATTVTHFRSDVNHSYYVETTNGEKLLVKTLGNSDGSDLFKIDELPIFTSLKDNSVSKF